VDRKEVMQIAREAEIPLPTDWVMALSGIYPFAMATMEQIERFASLVAERAREEEREKVAEETEILREIGENILVQNNRCTDRPMFIVQQKVRTCGFDPDYADDDGITWVNTDGVADDEEAAELEAAYQETLKEPDGWTRTVCIERWEFVTACFTEQGCKDYLAADGHNLREPRIYADGSYRNHEFRKLHALMTECAIRARGTK